MRKSTFYKPVFAVLITLFSLSAAVAQSGNKPAFIGTWKINYDKSDFGEIPHYVISKDIAVSMTAMNVSLKLIMETPSGADTTVNETLPLDGKIKEMIGDDKRKRAITAKISANGDTLRINTVASVPNNYVTQQYRIDEIWTISNNGDVLAIKKTVVPSGEGTTYTVTAIYNKE